MVKLESIGEKCQDTVIFLSVCYKSNKLSNHILDWLLENGHGLFNPLSFASSGINMSHDVKALGITRNNGQLNIVVVNNQGPLQLFVPSQEYE